jgi:trans-aconitate methyltransferase
LRKISEVLSESKRLFGGEADRDKLAELLLAHRPAGNLRWLEVGVGDGQNLKYLVDKVCKNVDLTVTAIDPQITVDKEFIDPRFVPIKSSFQTFSPNNQYDLINARHSIYYFGDDHEQIARLPAILASNGCLAITAWTEECVLFALHKAIASRIGRPPSNLTSTSAHQSLEKVGLQRVANYVALGQIHLQDATTEQLASMVELAARNMDVSHTSTLERAQIAREFISSCRDFRRHTAISVYAHFNLSNS